MSPSRAARDRRTSGLPALLAGLVLVVVVLAGLLVLSLLPGAAVVASASEAVSSQVLDFPPLPARLDELPERSVVLDRDGGQLAVLRAENRVLVEYGQLPAHLVDAVIATEDSAFRTHSGVNWRGVARAALGNLRAGEITSGGSGITQQLVKNLVVGDDRTYRRKIQEALYAVDLERRLSKEEILEAYLNDAYFANNTYGVGAAAEFYWGKRVEDLTVAEAALLAGVIRVPEVNDPVDHPERALDRRDIVLAQMVEQGYLTPAEAERAAAEPLALDLHPVPEPRQPFFAAYVRALLDDEPALGANVEERRRTYERGGLVIQTTLDTTLQERAGDIIAERLNSDGEGLAPDAPLGAITAVDPTTGEILTVAVGPKPFGDDEGETEVNPAVAGGGGSGRQAGSAFKAFEIVAALESGISPLYRIDTPSPYTPSEASADAGWAPGNYSDSGGGRLDMAEATAVSSNVYFAHLVDRTGPEKLVEVARRMGISSPLPPVCSLVLGTADVFPLEMASAFGTLANDGLHCTPYAIAEIRDRSGRVLAQGDGSCERSVSSDIARRTTQMLRGPLENGTATRYGQLDRPAAGKTGTTQSYTNAWFVGYVPQLSVAAWMGPEQPATMEHPACGGPVTGGCLPTMMWRDFTLAAIAHYDLPPEEFAEPPPLPTTTVPDVVGRDVERARTVLERLGFAVETRDVGDWRKAGTVVASDPAGGAAAPRGSVVLLDVSDGTAAAPTVPDVVGRGIADAERLLADVGLRVRAVTVPVADAARYEVVLGQDPQPGASAVTPAGRFVTVTLEVGRPARAGEVPRTFTAGSPDG